MAEPRQWHGVEFDSSVKAGCVPSDTVEGIDLNSLGEVLYANIGPKAIEEASPVAYLESELAERYANLARVNHELNTALRDAYNLSTEKSDTIAKLRDQLHDAKVERDAAANEFRVLSSRYSDLAELNEELITANTELGERVYQLQADHKPFEGREWEVFDHWPDTTGQSGYRDVYVVIGNAIRIVKRVKNGEVLMRGRPKQE